MLFVLAFVLTSEVPRGESGNQSAFNTPWREHSLAFRSPIHRRESASKAPLPGGRDAGRVQTTVSRSFRVRGAAAWRGRLESVFVLLSLL